MARQGSPSDHGLPNVRSSALPREVSRGATLAIETIPPAPCERRRSDHSNHLDRTKGGHPSHLADCRAPAAGPRAKPMCRPHFPTEGRCERQFALSCYQAVDGLLQAKRALSFAELRSSKPRGQVTQRQVLRRLAELILRQIEQTQDIGAVAVVRIVCRSNAQRPP
jgi:hypothetical protein